MTSTQAEVAPAQRRRGAALEDAILAAAFAELAEVGYAAFSVEGVASRARTGKASIYRRWPTRQQLVGDALDASLPTADQCGLGLDFPDDVSTWDALRAVAAIIATVITSPAGDAMRAIKFEAITEPELARIVDERFQAPRRACLLDLLRRGVARGEVRPEAVTPLIADVVPSMLMHRVLLQDEPLTDADVTAVIEEVLIPLVEVR